VTKASRSTRSASHPAAFKGSTTTRRLAGTRPAKAATPARSAAPDAVALLRADHKLVTELFEKFDKMKGKGPQKKALVERICNELTVHTRIEEEIFYPAARAALKDGDLMDEAQVEHDGAKQLIAQLRAMQPGDDMYDAKVTVLSEYIKHHVKEEQTDMFPRAKKTRLDMKALGQQMSARKQELMAQIDRLS